MFFQKHYDVFLKAFQRFPKSRKMFAASKTRICFLGIHFRFFMLRPFGFPAAPPPPSRSRPLLALFSFPIQSDAKVSGRAEEGDNKSNEVHHICKVKCVKRAEYDKYDRQDTNVIEIP